MSTLAIYARTRDIDGVFVFAATMAKLACRGMAYAGKIIVTDAESPDEQVELERYEMHEPIGFRFEPSRRQLGQMFGVGIVVSLVARQAVGQRGQGNSNREERIAQRFHLSETGRLSVLSGKVDVGQGARTQIAQAVSEELRIPLSAIDVILADSATCPNDGGTAGSRTTPATIPQVRRTAAALRSRLVTLAAERFQAKAQDIRQEGETFHSPDSAQAVTLHELIATAMQAEQEKTTHRPETLAPPEQWQVLGRTASHINAQAIVTGAHSYPSDIRRPGMRYGKVLRPPSYGATLTSLDLSGLDLSAQKCVVHDGQFVGCFADTTWQANALLNEVAKRAEWQRPPHPPSDGLFDLFKQTARWDDARADTWGNAADDAATHAVEVDAVYTTAYIQHVPMETRAAVAEWNDNHLTVWTGTQQPQRVLSELMGAFQLSEPQTRVIVPDTGCGFGGKHTGEVAVEAARLARAAGAPVSLQWTRDEEFTWAYFRPAARIEVSAALDERHHITRWEFTNYNSGGSALQTPYRTASGKTQFVPTDSPLRQGSYRALASTANTFARESMMDELALAAQRDPFAFRLDHLDGGRLRDVLIALGDKCNWARRRQEARKPGLGIGLACGTEKGSYVAACAEVEVINDTFRVLSICQVFECGAIQNPDNLRSQVEGAIVMGLGGALFEEIRFRDGALTQGTLANYTVPRLRHLPRLDIHLLNRLDLPSVGAGETPIIAVAPAIANAVFDASRVRLRSLPLRSTSLRVVS